LNVNYKVNKISINDFERIIKVFKFISICRNNRIKEATLFVKEEFKNDPTVINKHLTLLIDNNTKLPDCFGINDVEDVALLFKSIYLAMYKQCLESRLEKRIEYGIICYKTKMCAIKRNPDCPTCLNIVSGVRNFMPYARKDNSIILCKGSGKEMNETNQAYCFESGYIYCEEYIINMNYNYECKETKNICKENPLKCFFV
ncbi:hypothetical protein COBT_003031, partial [Conglomerata obtusa]